MESVLAWLPSVSTPVVGAGAMRVAGRSLSIASSGLPTDTGSAVFVCCAKATAGTWPDISVIYSLPPGTIKGRSHTTADVWALTAVGGGGAVKNKISHKKAFSTIDPRNGQEHSVRVTRWGISGVSIGDTLGSGPPFVPDIVCSRLNSIVCVLSQDQNFFGSISRIPTVPWNHWGRYSLTLVEPLRTSPSAAYTPRTSVVMAIPGVMNQSNPRLT